MNGVYKNHVNVDRTHKLIRRYAATDAAEHDSRQLDGLLRRGNTSRDVFGDSVYRSAAAEARLKAQGLPQSHSCPRDARSSAVEGQGCSEPGEEPHSRAHRTRVRCAGDGAQRPCRRTIGIVRARLKIGLQNFVYNIRRLATLARMATA